MRNLETVQAPHQKNIGCFAGQDWQMDLIFVLREDLTVDYFEAKCLGYETLIGWLLFKLLLQHLNLLRNLHRIYQSQM